MTTRKVHFAHNDEVDVDLFFGLVKGPRRDDKRAFDLPMCAYPELVR
jgi:hypothetical protein